MADQKTIEMLIKEADLTDINCSQCMAVTHCSQCMAVYCNCDDEVGAPIGF